MPKTRLLKTYWMLMCWKNNCGKCYVKKSQLGFFTAGLFRTFSMLLCIMNHQEGEYTPKPESQAWTYLTILLFFLRVPY